jgi:hypothetical protein
MTTLANRRRVQDARLTLDERTIKMDGLDVAVIDQLTNLRHLVKHYDLDWEHIQNMAQYHFNCETKEGV